MKKLLTIIAVLLCLFAQAQTTEFISDITTIYKKDTLIKNDAYECLYNWNFKAPIYVAYKLYHGGGDCDRSHFRFHPIGDRTATDKDYDFHYDKGHITNAEDFAYDCRLDEMTFRYYNCFPQTKELNRGKWKAVETTVRAMSQKDSLIVIAGGLYSITKIGNNVSVPDICWKVVYSLSKKQVVISKTFQNNTNPEMVDIAFDKLQFMIFNAYNVDISTLIK